MKKKQLLAQLLLEKDTPCFRTLYRLVNGMLEEARERNDSASIEEVPKIQGEIRILKYLLKELNTKPNNRIHYDGGFGG